MRCALPRPLLVAALAACSAEPAVAPSDAAVSPASLACGTLTYRVAVRRVYGCGQETPDERAETLPFDTAVDAGVEVDGTRAALEARCEPERLAVTLSGETETGCSTHCYGGAAAAHVRWTGTLRLPASSPRWRVRFVVDASRTFPRGGEPLRGPESPRGECSITMRATDRGPIVVDGEHLEREVVAPAGDAAVDIDCFQTPLSNRICYGVSQETFDGFSRERRLLASLALRIDARPGSP